MQDFCWLEAIDPKHRYWGHLKYYFDIWKSSTTNQPFIMWLDYGGGSDLSLLTCSREKL